MSNEREREAEKAKGFKVVDRRRFTESGEERPGVEPLPSVAPAPAATVSSTLQPEQPRRTTGPASEAAGPQPRGAAEAADGTSDGEDSGITFTAFLQSLAQQALMQLGMLPWPHTGQRELMLDQARDTIDILSLLRKKTHGNLSPGEDRAFEMLMYELRMTYVEVTNAIARGGLGGGPAGRPGSPGPGAKRPGSPH